MQTDRVQYLLRNFPYEILSEFSKRETRSMTKHVARCLHTVIDRFSIETTIRIPALVDNSSVARHDQCILVDNETKLDLNILPALFDKYKQRRYVNTMNMNYCMYNDMM
jgi:hypothetical protein